ncbi:hypothetical protein [Deinococcus multiflagellatus]|uniref:Uncharacterized protein n=1 Tax=Deinococcus multiflagellatus TaxID=1656887 RepID=A0ABW1ZSC1_9DEIO|nr:hypothetical protein [Deinococcus multiflagellatus]
MTGIRRDMGELGEQVGRVEAMNEELLSAHDQTWGLPSAGD